MSLAIEQLENRSDAADDLLPAVTQELVELAYRVYGDALLSAFGLEVCHVEEYDKDGYGFSELYTGRTYLEPSGSHWIVLSETTDTRQTCHIQHPTEIEARGNALLCIRELFAPSEILEIVSNMEVA